MNINEYIEEYRTTEGALLVDLREAEDYKRSHIPGAIHILPGQIRDEIRKLATFRTPIYLYCYAGIRSAQAAELLKAKGYQVFNIGSFEEYTGEKEGEVIHMDLKELRKEKGLSQAALAQSIGVKPVTISAIETGRMKISPRIAEQLRSELPERRNFLNSPCASITIWQNCALSIPMISVILAVTFEEPSMTGASGS